MRASLRERSLGGGGDRLAARAGLRLTGLLPHALGEPLAHALRQLGGILPHFGPIVTELVDEVGLGDAAAAQGQERGPFAGFGEGQAAVGLVAHQAALLQAPHHAADGRRRHE